MTRRYNFILDLQALTKFVGALSLILSSLFMKHFIYCYLGFFAFVVLAIMAEKGEEFFRDFASWIFPISLILLLILGLFKGEDSIVSFGFFSFKREGVVLANGILSRLYLIGAGLIFFIRTSSVREIGLYLQSRGRSRKEVFMFLSFFEIFKNFRANIDRFLDIQKSKGIHVDSNLFIKFRTLLPFLPVLYRKALDTVEKNLLILESRGVSTSNRKNYLTRVEDSGLDRGIRLVSYIFPLMILVGRSWKWIF